MSDENTRDALPIGSEVGGYIVQRVLGQGGFGITYAASSATGMVERSVAIKEFFPHGLAYRDDKTVTLSSRIDRVAYDAALRRFEAEARKLVDVYDHPNIVRGENVIHAYGSVFLIMEFVDGVMLQEWVTSRGGLPEDELRGLLAPVFDAVAYLHDAQAMHRDISPRNIMIRTRRRGQAVVEPVLIDFGAIGDGLDLVHDSTITVANPLYSPPEQQEPQGVLQGRFTDIFALGGCVYFAATGKAPIKPMTRLAASASGRPEPMPAAIGLVADRTRYSRTFFEGLDRALRLDPKTRPQTVRDLTQLLGWAGGDTPRRETTTVIVPAAIAIGYRAGTGWLVGAAFCALIAVGTAVVVGPKVIGQFTSSAPKPTVVAMMPPPMPESGSRAEPNQMKTIVSAPPVAAPVVASPSAPAPTSVPDRPVEATPPAPVLTTPPASASSASTGLTTSPPAPVAVVPSKPDPAPAPAPASEPKPAVGQTQEPVTAPVRSSTPTPSSAGASSSAPPDSPEPPTTLSESLTVPQLALQYASLPPDGGVVAKPRSAADVYHNARFHEQRGEALAARQAYLELARFDVDAIDAWTRFATVLRVQDGRGGARDVFAQLAPSPHSTAYDLVAATLYDDVERKRRIEAFVEAHPDYGPGWFLMADEMSEARLGSQTLGEKHRESEALGKFLAADEEGELVRHFMDPIMLGDWIDRARRRKTALDTMLTHAQSTPAAIFSRSNTGWSISVQLPEAAIGFAYRLGPAGAFTVTDPGQGIDPRTGKPMPNTLISIGVGQEPKEIDVRYTDLRGVDVGPFPIAFDPVAALVQQIKQTLDMTRGAWVAFGGGGSAPLMYMTHLASYVCGIEKASFGLDGNPADRPLPLPACNPKDPYAIPNGFQPYLKVPASTKSATVRVVFKDGTSSETVIMR